MLFVFVPILDLYKTQEMGDRVIYEDPFMLIFAPIDKKLRKCVKKLLMIVWED